MSVRARERQEEIRQLEACVASHPDPESEARLLAVLDAGRRRRPAALTSLRRVWGTAIVPLAAAAAFALFVMRQGGDQATAPEYVASVTGHVALTRSAPTKTFDTLEARPDGQQEVIVRPKTRSDSPRAARVLIGRSGAFAVARIEPDISPLGVVRFDMPGALLVGASEVRVVIAPPNEIEPAVRAALDGNRKHVARGVAIVSVPVEPPPT